MAQVVGGVLGGTVGFLIGGPAGAAVGFSIGSALGSAAQTIPGARIGEIARQTAKEGDPRPIVWGIVRPIGPNVIASEDPPRIVRRRQSGKGGPRVETESVYRTYALGVCEGPITGYRRIWRNNKLVYDARAGSAWGAENNYVFLERATLYLGDFEQMPDPSLEIAFGVGNVPAHRGTAYIVMVDEDLTDLGGAIPQWIFEVVRAQTTTQAESLELVLTHGGNPNITRLSVEDWSELTALDTGSGTTYGAEYADDLSYIVSHSSSFARTYDTDSGDLVDSAAITTTPSSGGMAGSPQNEFAYGMQTLPVAPVAALDSLGQLTISEGAEAGAPVRGLAYSPSGQVLAAVHTWAIPPGGSGFEDAENISFYDATSGYVRIGGVNPGSDPLENAGTSVAWSPAGDKVYMGQLASPYFRRISYPALTVDAGTPTFSSQILSVHVHPSGTMVAIGTYGGNIQVLDTATWTTLFSLVDTNYQAISVRFSEGGRYLAYSMRPAVSGSAVFAVREVATWDLVDTGYTPPGNINSIRWAPLQPVGF